MVVRKDNGVRFLPLTGNVLTTGGRMTNTQCFFIQDGPCQQRLIDLIFFRWRLAANDKGTVTFTTKGGDIKIRATVLNIGPDPESREGWVTLALFDENATLGAKWMKCIYDTQDRSGIIEVDITAVESRVAMH